MTAGQMLAEARVASKLSIRAAAARAGISATTWSRIETGTQSNSRPTTLVRCALAVGLPADAVLGALDLTIEERADVIQDVMTDLEHEREKAEAYGENSPEIGDVLSSIPDEVLLGELARRLRPSAVERSILPDLTGTTSIPRRSSTSPSSSAMRR